MAIVSDGQIFLQGFQKVRSILGPRPPPFVIYANKSDNLVLIPSYLLMKLDFLVVHDINRSWNRLNGDLKKISMWALQWKMNFNPDSNKQVRYFFIVNLRSWIILFESLTLQVLPNLKLKNAPVCFWMQSWILRNKCW